MCNCWAISPDVVSITDLCSTCRAFALLLQPFVVLLLRRPEAPHSPAPQAGFFNVLQFAASEQLLDGVVRHLLVLVVLVLHLLLHERLAIALLAEYDNHFGPMLQQVQVHPFFCHELKGA